MFKKAIELGAKWMKDYKAACEDHEKNGTQHWEYVWVYVVILGILFSIGHAITDPIRKAKRLEKKMTETK